MKRLKPIRERLALCNEGESLKPQKNWQIPVFLFFALSIQGIQGFASEPDLKIVEPHSIILPLDDRFNSEPNETIGKDNLSPQMTVAGVVTDPNGMPLGGVNVLEKGTQNGTLTDFDGNYSLSVNSANAVLVFSYIGMKKKEQPVDGNTAINIRMEEDTQALDEVVVVGYGTQSKRDLTGSISSVSSGDLASSSISNTEETMTGRMAGVNVSTLSHEPGGGISVNIRGTASINASGTPLYVIDGMPISTSVSSGEGSSSNTFGTQPSPLNGIDPSNIESIDVLKDASAAAIYGSRAANGVVLITTKKGKAGGQRIDFRSSTSISQVAKKLDFMTAEQWAIQANESFTLSGRNAPYTDQQVAGFGNGTNWQDEVFRSALKKDYSLRFSGGSDALQYSVLGSYLNEEGIVRGSDFRRYGTAIRIDAKPTKRLSISGSVNFTMSNQSKLRTDTKGYGGVAGIIDVVLEAPPTIPARDEEGNITNFGDYTLGGGLDNPLVLTDKYKQAIDNIRAITNFSAKYALTPELNLEGRIGADIRDFRYSQYFPIGSEAGGSGGTASQNFERNNNILTEGLLTYSNTSADNHRVTAVGGITYQTEKASGLNGTSRGFPSDNFTYNNLSLATSPGAPGSYFSKWQLISYFGRINYTFKDKYVFKVSGRYDGSSKFGVNSKYGFFPAGAIGWQLDREPFIEQLGLFSQLKVRVGYGETGNDGIGPYRSLARVGTAVGRRGAVYWNQAQNPYAEPNGVANPDLSWEKAAEWNYGVDFGFLNQRVQASANYFVKKTTDLLLDVPIPSETGFTSVLKNTGSMVNKGFEFEVSSWNFVEGDFKWNTSFNASFLKNEVTSLAGANEIWSGWVGGGNVSPHNKNTVLIVEGRPIGQWYGSVYLGTWKDQAEIDAVGTMPGARPGEPRYADLNGDGNYDADSDDTWIGDPNPKATWGLNNTFSYKRFNLNAFIYGKVGFDVLNITRQFWEMNGLGVGAARLNRWSPTNTQSDIPAAYAPIPTRTSSRWIEDGTFLRIQNVTLTYNVPIEGKGGIRSLQLGIAADNLVNFSNYTGYDPEVNARGGSSDSNTTKFLDLFSYPAARGFRFEIKIGL